MRKPAPIAWNARLSPARNASRTLPPLVRAYFAQGRQVVAAGIPPAELHALRLATKRLRYTLELFRPCYGRGMETSLSSLQGLQQILGKVNDCVAAGRLIEGLAPESAARTRMLQFVDRRAAATATALRKEWRERFDAPGKEQWWLRYLARNARALKKSL